MWHSLLTALLLLLPLSLEAGTSTVVPAKAAAVAPGQKVFQFYTLKTNQPGEWSTNADGICMTRGMLWKGYIGLESDFFYAAESPGHPVLLFIGPEESEVLGGIADSTYRWAGCDDREVAEAEDPGRGVYANWQWDDHGTNAGSGSYPEKSYEVGGPSYSTTWTGYLKPPGVTWKATQLSCSRIAYDLLLLGGGYSSGYGGSNSGEDVVFRVAYRQNSDDSTGKDSNTVTLNVGGNYLGNVLGDNGLYEFVSTATSFNIGETDEFAELNVLTKIDAAPGGTPNTDMVNMSFTCAVTVEVS